MLKTFPLLTCTTLALTACAKDSGITAANYALWYNGTNIIVDGERFTVAPVEGDLPSYAAVNYNALGIGTIKKAKELKVSAVKAIEQQSGCKVNNDSLYLEEAIWIAFVDC